MAGVDNEDRNSYYNKLMQQNSISTAAYTTYYMWTAMGLLIMQPSDIASQECIAGMQTCI